MISLAYTFYNLHAFLRNNEPGVSINVYIQLIKYCFGEVNLVVFKLTLYFRISHQDIAKVELW